MLIGQTVLGFLMTSLTNDFTDKQNLKQLKWGNSDLPQMQHHCCGMAGP